MSDGVSNPSRTLRARVCLRRASTRFSVSRPATVPSLSQPVAIAVISAGVFRVVAWMARSKASMNCVGRARIRSADQTQRSWTGQRRRSSTPARAPPAGGGGCSARYAYAASSMMSSPCCRAMATSRARDCREMTPPQRGCAAWESRRSRESAVWHTAARGRPNQIRRKSLVAGPIRGDTPRRVP